MNEEYLLSRYLSAAELLPRYMKEKLYRLNKEEMLNAEEIRLRSGSGVSVVSGGAEIKVDRNEIRGEELDDIICRAANSSLHTVAANIREGFLTAENGHRIGICGTAAVKNGEICGINHYSSLSIRISKEIKNAAEGIEKYAVKGGSIASVLIISPPGGGKTTFLRDMIRRVSNLGYRIAAADERGEIAAAKSGRSTMDIGSCTDVMDMAPRAAAVMYLLRAMNPQVIAMDEISSEREQAAATAACGCGVAIFATAHGDEHTGAAAVRRYKGLFESGVFDAAVFISGKGNRRHWQYVSGEELL